MTCPECGVEVVAEALFCHKCGAKLSGRDPAAETSPPATAQEQFAEAVAARRAGHEDREQEIWIGSYSSKAMLANWAICGLVTVVALIVAAIYFRGSLWWTLLLIGILLMWGYSLVVWLSRRLGVQYRLTSQRFFHETGVLRHLTDRVEVIDIDDVTCEQRILERLLGVGTIRINSSDRTHPQLLIRGIEDPNAVAGMIDDARRAERVRRGLHIEQV